MKAETIVTISVAAILIFLMGFGLASIRPEPMFLPITFGGMLIIGVFMSLVFRKGKFTPHVFLRLILESAIFTFGSGVGSYVLHG